MEAGTFFQNQKDYVGFSDESTAVLQAFHPLAFPHFASIVDDFYASIEANPKARAVITGGSPQVERLKSTLRNWISELLLGPHNEAYFEMRARIGRMHVRIGLAQEFMFTALNRMRTRLLLVADQTLRTDPERRASTEVALHQILDLDLAIMLETYKEDLEAKNRTAERMATIGQFAAGIGHELRNPLAVIESSVFLVQQRVAKSPQPDQNLLRHVDKISVETQRAAKTINDLLDLARNKAPHLTLTNVRELIGEAISTSRLPDGIQISVQVQEGLKVGCDPNQLMRVLVNLLTNASEAMNEHGHIWIEGESNTETVRLRVRDNGPGVPRDMRLKVFEALFTTKARGTGLGLALCRRILEAHKGTIDLAPTEPGACFQLTLPEPLSGAVT